MNNSRRKTRKLRVKQNLTRRLRTELLESRQLLAADVNPFHNLARPADVNGDGATNVSDLRVIFQDIAAHGTRELEMPSPLGEGEPGSNNDNFVDVNADGAVSPADLRQVYNAVLSGEGEADMQLEVFMDVVDQNDNPVFMATVGQQITLDVDIRDARIATADNPDGSPMWPGLNDDSNRQGVFAAYFDFAHSTNLDNSSAPDEFPCNFDFGGQNPTNTCQYDHGDYKLINKNNSFPTVDMDVDNNVPGQPDKVDVIGDLGGTSFSLFQTNRVNLVEIHFTVNGTDLTANDDTAQTEEGLSVPIFVLENDSVISELFFDRRVPNSPATEVSFANAGTPGNPADEHLSLIIEEEIFGDKTLTIPVSGVALGGLQIVSVSSGTATVNDNGTAGNTTDDFIDFTPLATNSPGSVNIVYRITDGVSSTATATAVVEVGTNNDPPVHTTPTLNGFEEQPIALAGVSVSDSDAGAATNITTTVNAQNGNLSATIGGSLETGAQLQIVGSIDTINAALATMTFTGDMDFTGQEVLIITTNDAGNTGDGGPQEKADNITVNVANVNDPPVLTIPGDQNVADDEVLPLGLDVDDVDSTTIVVDIDLDSATGASGQIGAINVTNTAGVTVTGNGSENVSISGPLALVKTALGSVNYTSDDSFGFLGIVTISVDANDQDGGLDNRSFDIEVEPGVLPRARRDTLIVDEDSTGSATVNVVDVLANDLTNDNSTAVLVSFENPADNGMVAMVLGDQLHFTPTADFAGSTTFTYVMNETPTTQGGVPSTGTVNVTVREENDAPTAANTTAQFMEDQVLSVADFEDLLDSLDVAPGGGEDEDGQTLTITSMILLNAGGATVSNTGITFDEDYNDVIGGGPLLIEYVVTDNGTTNGSPDPLSATATLTVNVTPKNDKPIANTETLSIDKDDDALMEDIAFSISIDTLLDNDTAGPLTATDEISSQTVSFNGLVSTTTSAGATLTINGNDLDYTPAADFNGNDTFSYTVSDGDLTSDPVEVTLSIAAVNDAPIPNVTGVDFSDDAVKGVPLTLSISDLLSNDAPGPATATDEALPLQTLSITAVQAGPNGTSSVEIVGTNVVYTPNPGFSGPDSFTYTLFDGFDVNIVTATVSIEVADFVPSSFSGYVPVDTNTNGIKDVGEQTLAGVEITLSGTDLNEPITVMTNAEGHYSFTNLTPGLYNITKNHIPFFIDGVEQLGTGGTTSPSNDTFHIEIGAAGGIDSEGNNFGVYGLDPNFFSIEELRAKLSPNGALIGVNGAGEQEWVSTRGTWGNMSASATIATSIATDMRMVTITVTDGATVHQETFDSHTDSRVNIMGDDGSGGAVIRLDGEISDLFSQVEAEGEADLDAAIDMLAAANNRVADVDKVFELLG